MNSKIINRVLAETNEMLETNKTIREISKKFYVSKSTVHKDLHCRLLEIDAETYKKIDEIMREHINVRHIRGGESTRQRYLK